MTNLNETRDRLAELELGDHCFPFVRGFDAAVSLMNGEIEAERAKWEAKITEEVMLNVIRDWKFAWMNQRQNSEDDYQNYFNRAFGVDANMQHSLAGRIVKALKSIDSADVTEQPAKDHKQGGDVMDGESAGGDQ